MKNKDNYLDKIPQRAEHINWRDEENDLVTLIIENKGIFNKLAQVLLKKPKTSYIHLDETGSFLWKETTGDKTLGALAMELEEKFGEKAHPLYERIIKFYKILESYGFISYKK